MAGQLAPLGSSIRPDEAEIRTADRPTIEITYRPQGKVLEQYILSTSKRTFIRGPLGSGKTNASCWKGFRICLQQEPDSQGVRKTRGLAVRNTYPELFSTTIKDWLEMFGDLGQFKQGGKEPPTHYLTFDLPDGTRVEAEVIFLALDREDHTKKLRGVQATWCWINEVKEIPFAIVSMLDLRMGRYPKDVWPTWHGIFGDTNAPDTDHWYYRLAEELRPEGWTFLTQPGGLIRASADHPWIPNPDAENLKNLARDYYPDGAQGKPDDWIKVNLANEYGFVADGMPVWPDYSDSKHCRTFELVPSIPLHIGMDFGLTPAAVIGQVMPNGQRRWRYEIVTTDTGIVRFASLLKAFLAEKCPGWPIGSITGDPAGDQRNEADNEERTVFQILAANGVFAVPAWTNDFSVRVEAVGKPMRTLIDGEPGFLIHPDMRVTRKGLQGGYKFRRLKVSGDERYEQSPVKNAYSHPCEALQYGEMGAGGGQAVLLPVSQERAEDAREYRAKRALGADPADVARFKRQRGIR